MNGTYLQHGLPQVTKEVPTLEEFEDRFLDGYARANRQKPSGIAAKETILNIHLVPLLGTKKLDAITTEDVQRLKQQLHGRTPKTVNNVLHGSERDAEEGRGMGRDRRMPCSSQAAADPEALGGFYDFDEYERLVDALNPNPNAHLIVLLGGEAGLRCGEMMALEWRDVDLQKRQICVQRSDWKGHVTAPKGGRLRYVPLTVRLATALREHRHLRSARVLCRRMVVALSGCREASTSNGRRGGLRSSESGVHRLRHTFCSHLAMRGAPARAIQELAGHQDLITTQRYMHLSPAAIDGAIGCWIGRNPAEIVETLWRRRSTETLTRLGRII